MSATVGHHMWDRARPAGEHSALCGAQQAGYWTKLFQASDEPGEHTCRGCAYESRRRAGKLEHPAIERVETPYAPLSYEHGTFLVIGGDLGPGYEKSPRVPSTAWCRMTIHTSGFVGSYGGEVWPSAWPALFRKLPASAQAGAGGFVLTELGRDLFGLGPQCKHCGEPAHADPRPIASWGGMLCKGAQW